MSTAPKPTFQQLFAAADPHTGRALAPWDPYPIDPTGFLDPKDPAWIDLFWDSGRPDIIVADLAPVCADCEPGQGR